MKLLIKRLNPAQKNPRAPRPAARDGPYALLDHPVTLRRHDDNPHRHRNRLPDSNLVGLVYARSGLVVKHGIALSNGVGVIDSDYTGESVG